MSELNSSHLPTPDGDRNGSHRNGSGALNGSHGLARESTVSPGEAGRLASRSLDRMPPPSPVAYGMDEEDDTVDVSRLFRALRRRWPLVLASLVGFTLLGAGLTMLQKPVYEAGAQILVTTPDGGGNGISLADAFPGLVANRGVGRSMGQQLIIIKSPAVQSAAFERALKKLTPEERAKFERMARPTVEADRDGGAFQVGVQSTSAQGAAILANAICVEYIAQNRKQNERQVETTTQSVRNRLDDTRRKRDLTARALRDYRAANGTIDIGAESQAQITQISQLKSELRANATERTANSAALRASDALIKTLPLQVPNGVVRDPIAESLRASIAELEKERLAQTQEYRPNSPVIRALDARIEGLKQRLARQNKTQVQGWQPNPQRLAAQARSQELRAAIASSLARERELNASIEGARRELAKLPQLTFRLAELQSNLEDLQKSYQTLNASYQGLRLQKESNVSTARVVSWARRPNAPVSPRKTFNLAVSMFLGLLLGTALALLLDRLDDRVHDDEDVEGAAGLPILAHVPFIKGGPSAALISASNPKTMGLVECFRMLRTNIAFAGLDEPLRSLVVTSSRPAEGKTTSAVNLAKTIALSGKRVMLVDCDLRHPKLHTIFGLPNEVGLSSVAAGMAPIESAVQATTVEGLSVVTSGPIPPNAPELLDSRGGRNALLSTLDRADFVIFDCPPALALTDAQIVATLADGVLLVASCNEASKRDVARLSRLMAQGGAKMLGVLFNKVDAANRNGLDQYAAYQSYYHGPNDPANGAGGLGSPRLSAAPPPPPPSSSRSEPASRETRV